MSKMKVGIGLLVVVVVALVSGAILLHSLRKPGLTLMGKEYNGELEFGALKRTYLVHVPAAYDGTKPTALVLAFHGGGGDGESMAVLTHLSRIADTDGFIVVYPDAYKRHWADGRGTTTAEQEGVDDVGFVSALIDQLAREYNIDLKRVYATGISNGGFFSQRLGCELPDKIATIAVVAATMPENLSERCTPERPVAVIIIHGTEDPAVPVTGGEVTGGARGKILSLAATLEKWLSIDACSFTPAVTYLPDTSDDGTRIRREMYTGCRNGTEVVLYLVEGGGHTWPGGVRYLPERFIGKTSFDIDAGEVIWQFFRKHAMS